MSDIPQIRAGVQQVPEGGYGILKSNNFADQLVQETSGKYMEWVRRGYVFTALTTSGTGAAISGVGSGTTYPVLWNKLSSGKIVIPLILQITPIYYGAGATVANVQTAGFCIASVTSAGDAINASYIAVLTDQTAGCMALGKASPSSKWSPVSTIGSAGVLTRILDVGGGLYVWNATAAMTSTAITPGAPFGNPYDFQSSIIMPPGTAIALCQTATAASTMTYHISLMFAELPNYVGF